MKKYIIKSLKWTKLEGYNIWYAPNSCGYTDRICDAGVYTEEDKNNKNHNIAIKCGVIEFVEITDELINTAKEQVKREIDKLESWLKKEKNKLFRVEEMENMISR